MRRVLVLLAAVAAGPLEAQAPERSLLPVPRGGDISVDSPVGNSVDPMVPHGSVAREAEADTPRPVLRAETFVTRLDQAEISPEPTRPQLRPENWPPEPPQVLAFGWSPRPDLRPADFSSTIRAAAAQTTPARVTEPGRPGQLCGRAGIFGEEMPPITGRIAGCGITQPVRVREVDGITLSMPATINCRAATALQDWLGEARDIVGRTGGGIASLRVVGHYSCRTRNNQPGGRLSEHATGNGIDIAGIGLANGQELTVLGGWREGTQGPLLRQLHDAACGPFGTVLGPESDRFHQDHFHFDVADYRAGPYCR